MQDHMRHLPVEIKLPRKYAKGGLATAARDVASAGEGGDTMVVHVNKAEFEQLRKQWGEPTINSKTGLPSYSWGSWLGPLAGVIGGATGIGGGIGDLIGGATGLYDTGSTLSSAIGSGLLGAGVGAISGGGKGALYGGLAGGATPYALSALGLGGAGGLSLGDTSAADAAWLNNPLGAAQGPTASGATLDTASKAASSGGSSGFSLGSMLNGSGKGGYMPLVMAGLVAANALGANRGPSKDAQAAAANDAAARARQQGGPLPQVTFNRTRNPLQGDPRKYGFAGGQQFFNNNGLGYARGGLTQARLAPPAPMASAAVSGPGGGRSDDIPARLSDGEYIVDAETTALLGDGSSKAGAAKLDQMRANIRRHKGGALAQGQISPNARAPEQYLGGRKA